MSNALTLAAALEILSPGHIWTSICVWCLARLDPQERLPARRCAAGGDCLLCSYSGRDVFVAALAQSAKRGTP